MCVISNKWPFPGCQQDWLPQIVLRIFMSHAQLLSKCSNRQLFCLDCAVEMVKECRAFFKPSLDSKAIHLVYKVYSVQSCSASSIPTLIYHPRKWAGTKPSILSCINKPTCWFNNKVLFTKKGCYAFIYHFKFSPSTQLQCNTVCSLFSLLKKKKTSALKTSLVQFNVILLNAGWCNIILSLMHLTHSHSVNYWTFQAQLVIFTVKSVTISMNISILHLFTHAMKVSE